jgi:hypothetical protein
MSAMLEDSVADPGCLSGPRILIFTHSGSRTPDLGSRIQKQQPKRGVIKLVVKPFFVATNFTKIDDYFIFQILKKQIWASFQRIIELFT